MKFQWLFRLELFIQKLLQKGYIVGSGITYLNVYSKILVLRQNYKSVDIVVTLSPFPIQKEYPSSWMYVVVVVGCNHRKFMIINHNPFSDWDVVYQCFITILCLFFENVLVMKMLMRHIIMSQKSINEWYHRTVYNISFCQRSYQGNIANSPSNI